MKRTSITALSVAGCCVLASATPVGAQLAVTGRIGAGDGSIGGVAAEIEARAGVVGSVGLLAGAHWIASLWGCADSWPSSYRCGYAGRGFFVGPSLVVIDRGLFTGSVSATLGLFSRGGGFDEAKGNVSWSIGGDVGLRLSRMTRLQIAVRRRYVRDPLYRDLFNEGARFTSVTAGLTVLLLGRDNSG